MFNSFKSRIIITVTAFVTIAIVFTIVFFAYNMASELTEFNEEHARQMIESVKLHIESQYNNILHHGDDTLERRKIELRNNTQIAFSIVEGSYDSFINGFISEDEAKVQVIEAFDALRYDNDIGYFWINDISRPYPYMIMHPTIPELNNQLLNSEEFFVVKDTNENLFTKFVDVVLESEEGYVEYLWPKPISDGLTEKQPKLSFVRLFEPWNWVIGTGLYIDDIDNDLEERLNVAIKDLNELIPMYSIGEEGYYYIFDAEHNMLVHPNVSLGEESDLRNPETGVLLMTELIEVASQESNYLDYLWNKPSDLEQYIYRKRSYVTYFEPLGWYIASSYYPDDFLEKVKNIVIRLTVYASAFSIFVLLIAILQMRSLFKPFYALINEIHEDKNQLKPLTIDGKYVEVKLLSDTINNMIASLKSNQDELVLTRQNLQNLLDSATLISIIATTPEGIIKTFNTGAESMLGYTAEELIDKTTPALFHLDSEVEVHGSLLSEEYGFEIQGFEVLIKKAKETGYEEREWTYIKKNGEHIIVKLGVTTIRNEFGRITGFLGVASDITKMKLAENELKERSFELAEAVNHLKQQEEKLEEMVKDRTIELETSVLKLKEAQVLLVESEKMAALGTLVAGVAHELNTPVGVAITLSSNLMYHTDILNGKLDVGRMSKVDLKEYLELSKDSANMIFDNLDRTAKLVNSFKQVSADQHNEMKRTFNVCKYINDVIRSMGSKLERANVTVDIQCEESLNLHSYPGALFQIITNLVLNSLKHGFESREKGTITIKFTLKNQLLILVYEDNGIGIPQNEIKKIFDPFYTTNRGNGGTGLGLNIVYNVVYKNLNGTIVCESIIGEYTRFTITIPNLLDESVDDVQLDLINDE